MAKKRTARKKSTAVKTATVEPQEYIPQQLGEVRIGYRYVSRDEALTVDAQALLANARQAAAELLAVISEWKLEDASHIKRGSHAAESARNRVELKEHLLTHHLAQIPRVRDRHQFHSIPFLKLDYPKLENTRAAIGLLDDAVRDIFRGASWEQRKRFGITTVAKDVCEQLRQGIELIDSAIGKPARKKRPSLNTELCEYVHTLRTKVQPIKFESMPKLIKDQFGEEKTAAAIEKAYNRWKDNQPKK